MLTRKVDILTRYQNCKYRTMCQSEEAINEAARVVEQERLGLLDVEQEEEDEHINDDENCISKMILLNNHGYNAAITHTNLYKIDAI